MNKINTDIIIIGTGLSGLLCANILSNMGIECVILEKNDTHIFFTAKNDGRALAISYDNYELMFKNNLLDNLNTPPSPIKQIRIADEHSPFFLHFDNKIIDNKIMGYMIDAMDLQETLFNLASKSNLIQILDNQNIEDINNYNNNITVKTQNHEINAKLVIAADGKKSFIREKYNIDTYGWDYNQTAIICNITHELNHQNIALELFLPNGPFAVLPLYGGYKSAIVWTEKTQLSPYFLSLNEQNFLQEIHKKMDGYLGKISLDSKIYSYQLAVRMAKKYYSNRIALIGDAAHFIHPIAGQGFNLGIRDIESLTDLIARNKKIGLDIGASSLLKTYHNSRIVDNTAMLAFTDLTNRIFSNRIFPIRKIRKLGLAAANKFNCIKKNMMLYAMGDK